ncbi:MAG: hypothetical protein ACR2MN_15155 [Acidimicrobiales bacterium]
MGLYVAANLGSLQEAAGALGGAVDPGRHAEQGLSLGDAGADDAVNQFAGALHGYAAGLADAARRGAGSLQGYAVSFRQADGG